MGIFWRNWVTRYYRPRGGVAEEMRLTLPLVAKWNKMFFHFATYDRCQMDKTPLHCIAIEHETHVSLPKNWARGGASDSHNLKRNTMASYVESTLIKDEKIIYAGKISAWSLAPLIILGFVFLGFFGIGLIFWISAFLRYKTTELAFTNKRVIAKFGFIRRQTVELNINKVESMQVVQGILGRICNFGTLVISGAGNPSAPIPGISDPMAFRRAFMEFQDQGIPQAQAA